MTFKVYFFWKFLETDPGIGKSSQLVISGVVVVVGGCVGAISLHLNPSRVSNPKAKSNRRASVSQDG